MRSAAPLLLSALMLGACSDGGTGTSSAAGSGGNAGSGDGGSGTGGSAPSAGGSAPAAGGNDGRPRGAVSLQIVSGPGCSLEEQYQDFPVLTSGHPVTSTEVTETVVHGGTTADGEPVEVECRVFDTPFGVALEGTVRIGPAGAQRSATVGAVAERAEAFVSLESPALGRPYLGTTEQCVNGVIQTAKTAPGGWASVACSTFASDDGTDSCELGPSYFYFENCRFEL